MPIASFTSYMLLRKDLTEQREAFFFALKNYFAPTQILDRQPLGEPSWGSVARNIVDDDWVINPVRGYAVLRESTSRVFRFAVEQVTHTLSVRVQVNRQAYPAALLPAVVAQMACAPQAQDMSTEDHQDDPRSPYLQWTIPVPDLYTDAQHFEEGLLFAWRAYDAAILAITETSHA